MIKVNRVAKPTSLQSHEVKWLRKIRAALDLCSKATTDVEQKNAKDKLDLALNKYSQTDVKTTLVTMFHGKCAYCEAKITHIDYGDIEHFRPKDIYPLLAVEWDNLLLACRVCNGAEFKGTKFPLDSSGNPLLINPCIDEPDAHLEFVFDEKTKFALVVSKDTKGAESEKTYGLNRNRSKDNLVQHRSLVVQKLIFIATYYHTDTKAKELLDLACENSGEYAAFARMVKNRYT